MFFIIRRACFQVDNERGQRRRELKNPRLTIEIILSYTNNSSQTESNCKVLPEMNIELLEQARARVPSVPVLVNMVSLRFRELNSGMRPLVIPLSSEEDRLDIVLREIAEGKLQSEYDFDALARDGRMK